MSGEPPTLSVPPAGSAPAGQAKSAALRPLATSTPAEGQVGDGKRPLFGGNVVLIASNVLFFALLAIGAIILFARNRHKEPEQAAAPSVVAADSLAANRLLQAGDLTVVEDAPKTAAKDGADALSDVGAAARDKLVGHYLVVPVARGKRVSAAMVGERPDLSLAGGAIAVGIAVDRKDVSEGRINAGTEVIPCSGDHQVGTQSYLVQAVLCPSKGQSCLGELVLPPERRGDVAFFGPGLAPRLSARACAIAP